MKTPIIYVAGAFTHSTPQGVRENIRCAAEWGHKVRKLGAGVLVPHLLGSPYVESALDSLPDSFGYEWWIKETLEHMRRCDAVFMTPGWLTSKGSVGEHKEASRLHMPVLYTLEQCERFVADWKRSDAGPTDVVIEPGVCDHGVTFNSEAARVVSAHDIRKRWPRLMGNCPKGCGFSGIGYASYEHYIAGDW